MGQKVNPIGLRTALTKNWESRWFAKKSVFGDWLHEDLKIRTYIRDKYVGAAIARIQIERSPSRVRLTIFTARPGLLLGKKGADIDALRNELGKVTGGKEVHVDVSEIKRAETNAQLVSESIAMQLERRIGFRRAMKKAIQSLWIWVLTELRYMSAVVSAALNWRVLTYKRDVPRCLR